MSAEQKVHEAQLNGEIQSAVDSLKETVSFLRDELEALRNRLAPILPDSPTSVGAEVGYEEKCPASPLGRRLAAIRTSLREANDEVRNLREQIQL